MEGRKIPYLANWLRSNRSLGQRVEDGRAVEDLLKHAGWAVLEEMADVVAEHGEANLAKEAAEVALSVDLQKRIDFARKRGIQDMVTFPHDLVSSVLDSAKNAAAELRNDAAETAAEGTHS